MSLSISYSGAPDGNDGPFDLGSASGWSAFREWAEALPNEYEAVRSLAVNGTMTGTHNLSGQLEAAMDAMPPNGLAAAAAELLIYSMGVGDPEETATVTGVD